MDSQAALVRCETHLNAHRDRLGAEVVETTVAALRWYLEVRATAAPRLASQQRKLATVLFAEAPGAWDGDVEAAGEARRALWARLDAVAVEYGGHVDKHVGDTLMAVWGAEVSRADDPERAVGAALALKRALHEAALHDAAPHLRIRVAVNTGPVLLGAVGATAEFTALGDTVNVASRLQGQAAADEVLISHDTYRHLRGAFVVEPLEPLRLKGKTEPLAAYRVVEAASAAFLPSRGLDGVDAPIVGRAAELARLTELWVATRAGALQGILVCGDAGVGKTRLLAEFRRRLGLAPTRALVARASAHAAPPYALVRDLFCSRYDIHPSDSALLAREKLESGVLTALDRPEKARFIGGLIGFDLAVTPQAAHLPDDVRLVRQRAFSYIMEWLTAQTAAGPLLLCFEDVQDADDGSLDWLEYVLRAARRLPLLVMITARPALLERRPAWAALPGLAPMNLAALSSEDSRALVGALLRRIPAPPQALVELLVGQAGGNPFYIEEFIQMLIEDRVILPEDPVWRVAPQRMVAMRIPATLTGILQARFDALSVVEREILQRAAVVGPLFWDAALMRLAPEGEMNAALAQLLARELIARRPEADFSDAQAYGFKAPLLHEVVYETVLRQQRREWHSRAALWLTQRGGRAVEYAGEIAVHFERAGDAFQAAAWYQLAGVRAAERFDHVAALRALQRALDLTPVEDRARRYELLLVREGVYTAQDALEQRRAELAALEELAVQLGDDARRAEVALRRAACAHYAGDYRAAAAIAQEAIALALRCRSLALEARGHQRWGMALTRLGDYLRAQFRLKRAITLAQSSGLAHVEADACAFLGVIEYNQGDCARAEEYYQEALVRYRQVGARLGEGDMLNNLGLTAYAQGEYKRARESYQAAVYIYREIGRASGEAKVLSNLGLIALEQGDLGMARQHFEMALALAHEMGARPNEASILENLGTVADCLGDYVAASEAYAQGLAICREIEERSGEASILAYQGLLLHHQGAQDAARDHCRAALAIATEQKEVPIQVMALTFLGHALAALGDGGAQAAYERALELWQPLDQVGRDYDARAGLARLALARGQAAAAWAYLEPCVPALKQATLGGVDEPFRLYLTAVEVLRALGDPQAAALLERGASVLRAWAARLPEAARGVFLAGVAAHRELLRLQGAVDGA